MFLLSLGGCLLTVQANASVQKIQWLVNDAPPFFILAGEHQQQGICDVTLAHLKKALPEIEHETLILPHTRLSKYLDEGAKACFPCMIKRSHATDRAMYSRATVVYPPHVLVTAKPFALSQKLNRRTPVSLQQLLVQENAIFAKHGGRKFGSVLDAILSQYSDEADELILRNEGRSTTSILDMLRLGRADFSIEYPAIVNYYNVSQQQHLQAFRIVENGDTPVAGAVGCSASAPDDFARKALANIDTALAAIVVDKVYQKQVTQWFSRHQMYDTWYENLVLASSQRE